MYFEHAQDDQSLQILHIFEGTYAADIIMSFYCMLIFSYFCYYTGDRNLHEDDRARRVYTKNKTSLEGQQRWRGTPNDLFC